MPNLADMLNHYRRIKGITLRQLAKEIGIGAATLLRIEKYQECDSLTMRKLMAWVFAGPEA